MESQARMRRTSGAPAARALRADRPLDRVRRRAVPAEGPQGRRLPARAHARGGLHPALEGPVLVVQGAAATIYQIQGHKYRDEARPRRPARARVSTMKDAYSFDVTDAGLDASYQAGQRDAYERIFARLGRLRDRRGGCGRDGRPEVRGVPPPDPGRRGHSCVRPAATRRTSRRSERSHPSRSRSTGCRPRSS